MELDVGRCREYGVEFCRVLLRRTLLCSFVVFSTAGFGPEKAADPRGLCPRILSGIVRVVRHDRTQLEVRGAVFGGLASRLVTYATAPAAVFFPSYWFALRTRHSPLVHYLFPFRTFFEDANSGISVVGSPLSSPQLGAQTGTELVAFHAYLQGLGFHAPDQTRVYLIDRPIVPKTIAAGPYASPFLNRSKGLMPPRYNLWLGFDVPSITLAPLPGIGTPASQNIRLHEYTHLMLHHTYRYDAIVNQRLDYQESIADFAAANFTGDPEIRLQSKTWLWNLGADLKVRDLRDPKQTRFSLPERNIRPPIITTHDRSVFLSHILWRMRDELGKEKMSESLKPFLDALNAHGPPFLAFRKDFPPATDPRSALKDDMLFYLMLLNKTISGGSEAKDKVAAVTARMIADYQLDEGRFKLMHDKISPGTQPLYTDSDPDHRSPIQATGYRKAKRMAAVLAACELGFAALVGHATWAVLSANDDEKKKKAAGAGEPKPVEEPNADARVAPP